MPDEEYEETDAEYDDVEGEEEEDKEIYRDDIND